MIKLRKPYRKIGVLLLCSLVGWSLGAQKTYAIYKSLLRTTNTFHGRYAAYRYFRPRYLRYAGAISDGKQGWSYGQWHLPGAYLSGARSRMKAWPYLLCGAFVAIQKDKIKSDQAEDNPSGAQSEVPLSAPIPKKLNFSMAPAKAGFLVDRTKAMASLAYYLNKPDKLVILPPITGFSGLGKTQLVHQLIAQHATKYDHIVWINASTQQDIQASYRQIAADLRIALAPNEDPKQEIEKVINAVDDKLKDKHVLYVFDNAPNPKTIHPYLSNGHVLITSSNDKPRAWWSLPCDESLALAPFSEKEALQLAKAMGQDITDKGLIKLIQRLPKNPLAIRTLLSVMAVRQYSPEAFLHKIKENPQFIAQTLANPQQEYMPAQNPSAYDNMKDMLQALKKERNKLAQNLFICIIQDMLTALASRRDGPALISLVRQMACLDATPIPLSFIVLALGKGKNDVRDVLLVLERNGLIMWDGQGIVMPDAIQNVIGDLYPLTSAQVENLVDRYVAYTIDKIAAASYPTADLGLQMIPHGEKLLAYVQKQRGEDIYTAKCYLKLSYLYCAEKEYDNALIYGAKALALFVKVHGNIPHADIASACTHLGNAYYSGGEYDRAFECYDGALHTYTAIYGDIPHAEIALAYLNLGKGYDGKWQYDEAKACYQHALHMQKEVYGSLPHTDIASTYDHLGSLYYTQGIHDQAIPFYQKALDMYQKVYHDKPHTRIAIAYNKLSTAYYKQGQYDEAVACYKKALDILEAVYLDTPDINIAYTYSNLGEVYRMQDRYVEALKAYKGAFIMLQALYGNIPHADIALAYNNLGNVYNDQELFPEAMQCYKQSLTMLKAIYEDTAHPDIALAYNNLGSVYYQAGLYAQAIACYQDALTVQEEVYGDTPHPAIAVSHHNLGAVYYSQWRLIKAFTYWRKEKAMLKKYQEIITRG